MKGMRKTLILAALVSAGTAMAKERPAPVYGSAPAWQDYRERAERAIISRLIDPDSAKISWLGGYYQGEFKPALRPRTSGYVACGLVNAKNRMGGYTVTTALSWSSTMISSAILRLTIARRALLPRSALPPCRRGCSHVPVTPAAATPVSATGLTLRAMPEGAYVSAVAPGSSADKAGLRPGMVIETINAISLQNMGEAMTKVVDAAGVGATLGLVGGKIIKMGEQP